MQTAYPVEMEIALEGQLADISPRAVGSYAVEGAGVAIGRAVVQGAEDVTCKAPSAAGQRVLGVVGHSHARDVDAPGEKDMVNVLRAGAIYVRPEQAVTPADKVFVVHSGATAGRFRKDADTDKAAELQSARWRTSAAANGLAVLEINLP